MNTRMATKPQLPDIAHLKPLDEIKKIIEALTPFSDSIDVSKGEILRYSVQGKKVCYILHSGSITLNRRGDGIIINSEQAPFIFGMSNQLMQTDNLYLRVMENSRISRISIERFTLVVESFELWKSICKTMIYCASRVYDHCARIAQMSSNELIEFQLEELMNESERIRNSITAANYITSRTYLSRSNVMRILAELRDSGRITLRRGILVSINVLATEDVA